VFAASLVELETRAAGEPDGGDGFVVERRGEFIEAKEAASPEGDKRVNSDVEDAGGLAQTRLRSDKAHSNGILRDAESWEKKKGGQIALPASCYARQNATGPVLEVISCQT